VEVRPRGVAGERQWGTGKLSKGLGWAMGGSRWGLHGEQEGAGVGGDGGGGVRGPGQVKSRNKNGMERQETSAALEPEKRERGGMHGRCHGGDKMAAAEPRNGVACMREGQEGGARAAFGLGVTHGVAWNWRWRRGAAEAQHMAGELEVAPGSGRGAAGEAEELPEEEEERRGSEGPHWKKQKTSGTSL
jgi:hypothetical protein